MGAAMWFAAGAASFLVARIVPLPRPKRWVVELLFTLVTALALGAAATVLDFGGWNEPDWRAGVFALVGSFAIPGLLRR